MSELTLEHLQKAAWGIAHSKGLHANLEALPVREATMIRLALIHTEVSEATQLVKRHGLTPTTHGAFGEELADILIRVADLAECLTIDLASQVEAKLAANSRRPYQYGTPEERKEPPL